MAKSLHTNNVDYINNNNPTLTKSELSLETQVFLAFKYREKNRRKLLKTLLRSGVNKDKQLTNKTKFIGPKAVEIGNVVLNKLIDSKEVLLNHKYLSKITFCRNAQNNNILKELGDLFDIKYYRFIYKNGHIYEHHIEFKISVSILEELRHEGIENREFYPQKIASPYNNNKHTFNKSIRSSAQKSESSFNSDLISEEGSKENEIISSEETKKTSIHVLKPSRPPNKRKKRTKAEVKARKAKVFVFRQYSKKQDLAAHYPLNPEDCSKLQVLSGRDFTLNAMNEILLDMSKRVGRLFSSKAQFMAYMAKVYENEKRDVVKTSNTGFKIKANQTEESRKERIYEQFLSKIEQQAINHVCPENQLKAKLAGTLSLKTGYNLLLKIKSFNIVGSAMRIHLNAPMTLKESEEVIVLSQVRAVYGDVDDLEFVVDGVGRICSDVSALQIHESESLDFPQGVWGEISQKIIDKYGVDIYKSWFAKLTVSVDSSAKTIELSSTSSLVVDWISQNYGIFMQKVASSMGLKLRWL